MEPLVNTDGALVMHCRRHCHRIHHGVIDKYAKAECRIPPSMSEKQRFQALVGM